MKKALELRICQVFLLIYQWVRAWRYSMLHSVFGVVVHCKHSPTCGTYFFEQVRQRGWIVGTLRGLWRVLRCW